jgi:uncharacterized protein (TIGR01777 family)
MKVVITGATGLIGRALAASFQQTGNEVVALTRRPESAAGRLPAGVRAAGWDGKTDAGGWGGELAGAAAVIHLAGVTIGPPHRWTAARKRELVDSRVRGMAALVAAIAALKTEERPPVVVSASGIDYYGDREDDAPLAEDAAPGDTFLARLCVQWEEAARQAEPLGSRVVTVRTAVVVAAEALAFKLLVLPFRLFAGGPLGNGRRYFSWIHLHDLVGLYRLAVERHDLQGALNAVAPDARPEREVAREIGRVLGRPSWIPTPAFALRIALGEQADLVLHGRRVVPARAQAAGYQFRFPDLPSALEEALRGGTPSYAAP